MLGEADQAANRAFVHLALWHTGMRADFLPTPRVQGVVWALGLNLTPEQLAAATAAIHAACRALKPARSKRTVL